MTFPPSSPFKIGASGEPRAHRASTRSGAAEAPDAGRAETRAADWEGCGLYVTTFDELTGRIEISLEGEVLAHIDGPHARDFFDHIRTLKSAGAKTIFIDGALFALRANELELGEAPA